MIKYQYHLLLLVFAVLLSLYKVYVPSTVLTSPSMALSKANMDQVTLSGSDFAVDLYKILRKSKPGENMFFSPYSIIAAVGMTLAGARGNTKTEMLTGLRFPKDADYVHDGIRNITEGLKKANKDVQLNVANKLYPQQGYQLLQDFVDLVMKVYESEAQTLDFSKSSEAKAIINSWVEEKTKDKIKDLIPDGVLTGDTRLVLVNAIYFKGNWLEQFDPSGTQKAPFFLLDGLEVKVDMMYKKDRFALLNLEDLDARALEIPYKGEEISMIIILPNKKDGLPQLEERLTGERVKQILSEKTYKEEVKVYLPKFKIEDTSPLNDPLKQMGMVDMFDENKADLSGISGCKDLYVSAVLHKAFVEVNEEGTEAAAATAMFMMACSLPPPPSVFKADHPFFFYIAARASKSILFVGSLSSA